MEPPDPARAAGGRACSPSQVGPRRTPARALAEPSRPAETWLRAGRLARELRSRAHRACGKGRGPGRGGAAGWVLDAGNVRERRLLLSLPRQPAAVVEKSCAWKSDLLGSRREPSSPVAAGGLGPAAPAGTAARGSWAQVGAPGTVPGGPPRGHPRGAWSVACGSRRPQTSAASLIRAAFL